MTPPQPTVAIAGGGLAGLAAACALSDAGFRVTLFEKRPFLGGRSSSYQYPGTGEVVDNCQHVLFPSARTWSSSTNTSASLIKFAGSIG
jgi:zeta-carotene desaturase